MKKKVIATMLVCGLCVGMLSGCGEEEEKSSRREKKSDKSKTESSKELNEIFEGFDSLFGKEEPPAATTAPDPDYTDAWQEGLVEKEPTKPGGDASSVEWAEKDYWSDVDYWEEDDYWDTGYTDPYTIIIDPNTGKPYDLGGMEIIIRDWWSPEEPAEPCNVYEETRDEYREWVMETYNFTIKQIAMGDWGSNPQDFVDYVTTGGDDINYIFTLRDDPAVTSGMHQGLMYDLSTIDCLDFTETKFTSNKVHELYAKKEKIFAMNAGYSEPRCGMYFNKRVLMEAGIDPESIYDMQAAGTWTWEAWTDVMAKVQRDINGDGVIDIYGMDANYGVPVLQAVYSNNSELVGMDEYGNYTYKFEDPATIEALEWINDVFKDYGLVRPADAQWDYYKEAFVNGYVAFCPDEAYMATANQPFGDTVDEIGFVMFPKGPQASDYTNCWVNNIVAIPACYDADRAEKIAFAWDLFTAPVPGYEDYIDIGQYRNNNFDDRAVDETIVPMMFKGMITYHVLVPNLDIYSPFLWLFGQSAYTVVADILENNRYAYMAWIEEANRQ